MNDIEALLSGNAGVNKYVIFDCRDIMLKVYPKLMKVLDKSTVVVALKEVANLLDPDFNTFTTKVINSSLLAVIYSEVEDDQSWPRTGKIAFVIDALNEFAFEIYMKVSSDGMFITANGQTLFPFYAEAVDSNGIYFLVDQHMLRKYVDTSI